MESKLKNFFRGKKILVVGGTGSWGSELVHQLVTLYSPAEIRVFSRGEHKQVEMRRKYQDVHNINFIVGDVRDAEAVTFAMHEINVVFNLAALKHVPVCEENVWEAIQTNVYGAHNIVNAAIKCAVDVVVQVSTDKAVDPLNLYGFTKGCAEKLITSANFSVAKPKNTKFVCVRGGNVLSTTGSVVPLFKNLIRKYNKVAITDSEMSRFLMRVEEAIELVLKAAAESIGGEVFVIRMPGARITDLAQVMIDQLGNKNTVIENIGIRPGEKLYEVLVSRNESPRTVEDGRYYIILPDGKSLNRYASYKKIGQEEYNSRNTFQLDKKGILALLEKDGWLTKTAEDTFSDIFSPIKDSAL
jgi:UDP-N-acetylglucosamine 4,6-dehydratase/5-epimerase